MYMLRFHSARLCISRMENESDYGCIWFKKYESGGIDMGIELCNMYTLQYVCQECVHEPDISNISMEEIKARKENVTRKYGVVQKAEEYLLNISADYEMGSFKFEFLIKDSRLILQNEKYVYLPVKNSSVLDIDIKEPESLDDMIAYADRLLEKRYGIHFLNV